MQSRQFPSAGLETWIRRLACVLECWSAGVLGVVMASPLDMAVLAL
ncbi:hypothetical protein [Thiocystis violacea]|nr:hypothetical protein [Thiocystis violacea]